MKTKTKGKAMLAALLSIGMTAILVFGGACSSKAAVQQELEGVVQAIDNKEAVLTLDDGSRIRVEIEKSADDVKNMVGEDVKAIVEPGDDNKKKLVEVTKKADDGIGVPKDLHFIGAVESITPYSWVIGGKTFKVNAATMLDQGVAAGVTADVEFITLSDGSLLATKIETNADDDPKALAAVMPDIAQDFSFTGLVQSISQDKIVVADKTFKRDVNTLMDNGLAAGVLAKVEFIVIADGSFLALSVETDAPDNDLIDEDMFATGPIESLTADSILVDGRTFKITPTTVLDRGLKKGALAKVEFIAKPDGTLVATQIETTGIDEGVNLYFSGPIQAVSAASYIVGGKTFKLTPLTKLDTGLVVGAIADVQFVIQPDGSLTAIEIETGGFEFIGTLQSISPTAYVVGGRTFVVNAASLVDQGLRVKKLVKVKFIIQPGGSLLAKIITAANAKLVGFSFKGVVQTMGATSMMVSTRTFQVNPTTVIGAGVAANKQVIVRFDIQPGGAMLAQSVQLAATVK